MTVIPILMYHSISSEATRGFRRFTLHPKIFAAHIAFLREQGYSIVSLDRLLQPLPEKPVVLTFDDGFLDFYTTVLPILQNNNATASLFVPTAYLDGTSRWLQSIGEGARPLISRRQLLEIANAAVDCGAHTHSHCHLDTVTAAQGRAELAQSKEILEQIIGRTVSTFAYPYGHHHPEARQWVVDAGFRAACAVRNAVSHSDDDLFALARLTITDQTSVGKLASLLTGPLAKPGVKLTTRLWRQVRLLGGSG